ncbi:VTC domain-containing protein [bacterium]|nr:VTC domain-containing protein [bacterium]
METRFEKKWKINGNYFYDIYRALTESNFNFIEQYDSRWVNSIYYDNDFFNSILQNLDGNELKKKIRLRWYGSDEIINNLFLEIKSKKGMITQKRKINLRENKIKLNHKLLKKIQIKILKKYPNFLGQNPLTKVRYNRTYFISKDKNIRATIDRNISYQKINNHRINFGSLKDNDLVLEFKYNTGFDNYVRNNLRNISLRLSKNSKFINSFFGSQL